MTGWMQDVRYAVRQLVKAPGFTLTAVATLALGIGANTAIFTVFNQVLLRTLPVEKPGELVRLSFIGSDMGHVSAFGGTDLDFLSYPMYRDLRDRNTVFRGLIADDETQVGAVWKSQPELLSAEIVSGNYFDVLGVKPAAGRLLLSSDDVAKEGSPVVVLSFDYWKTRFDSSRDVVNQTLLINGHPFTIVGVAAQGFSSAINGYTPKVFVPLTMKLQMIAGRDDLDDHRSRWLNVVGRLKPSMNATTATAAMTTLWRSLRADELSAKPMGSAQFRERFVAKSSMVLTDDAKGFSPLRDSLRIPLMILMGMVLLLAAMTCVNLASLLLVRAAARGREFAVRYAMGAGRARILRQLLIEGLLLGTMGGGLGLVLAPLAATVLVRGISGDGDLPFSVRPEGAVLWFNLLLSVGISLLFSMAPALQMMKPDLNEALRQQSASTLGAAQRFRRTAIAVQIGLSVLLLSGAGLFVRTLHNLRAQDMGMSTDHLVEFGVSPTMAGYAQKDAPALQDRVRSVLAALPGVRTVGATNDPVLTGNDNQSNITIEGYAAKPDEDLDVETPWVTPNYFAALGIPVIVGRDLTEADTASAQKVALVNKTFAVKFFGSPQKALGHSIGSGGGSDVKLDTQIVGVVGDAKQNGVREGVVKTLYRSFVQDPRANDLMFYVRTEQAPSLVENAIRAALHGIDPKLVVDSMRTMDEQIDQSVSNERMMALLAMSFALVALLTTAVGLYGVLAYATAQRTKEIGIRMALGAQRSAVVRLVLMDMAKVAAIGIVMALPVAVLLARWLRSELFEVQPFDPLTMIGCVVVTVAMVLLAAALPARRAASVEPTKALRAE
jgi:putative ABC transport system permease protein